MKSFNNVIKGKKKIRIYGDLYDYEGELDQEGRATGFGKASYSGDPFSKIEGTFLEDLRHGISMA